MLSVFELSNGRSRSTCTEGRLNRLHHPPGEVRCVPLRGSTGRVHLAQEVDCFGLHVDRSDVNRRATDEVVRSALGGGDVRVDERGGDRSSTC